MAMFKYYIFDPFEGEFIGTNSESVMSEFAECEDYHVIKPDTNENINPDGSRSQVREVVRF